MNKEKELENKLFANIKYGPNTNIHSNSSILPDSVIHKIEPCDEVKQTTSKAKSKKGEYEMVNHPTHYNQYDVEVVDMMEKIWGTQATMEWCKMTAYKYRMRMGTKPGKDDTPKAQMDKLMEDFQKEQWYLNKYDELKKKLTI